MSAHVRLYQNANLAQDAKVFTPSDIEPHLELYRRRQAEAQLESQLHVKPDPVDITAHLKLYRRLEKEKAYV